MLISAAYVSKIWTTHERRSALARAVEQREEYILPIRLDETEVPGFPASRSYLRWPPESAQSIAAIIKSKLSIGSEAARSSALVRSNKSAKRTIRAFQDRLEELYKKANKDSTFERLSCYLARTYGYLAKKVAQNKATSIDFIRPLSWLLALASNLGIDIQEAFLTKYPDKCPSCLEQPCVCFKTNKMPKGDPSMERIQEELAGFREQVSRQYPNVPLRTRLPMFLPGLWAPGILRFPMLPSTENSQSTTNTVAQCAVKTPALASHSAAGHRIYLTWENSVRLT